MRDELAALPIPWPDLSQAFHVDGSFRDLVITDTGLPEWQRVLDYVRELGETGRARIEPPDPFPHDAAAVLALTHERAARLAVFIGKIQLNCFFFDELEVEFDLDPREVTTEGDALRVLSFMRGLGEAVGRPVHLTEENVHDWRWLTFDSSTGRWIFEPEAPDDRRVS